MQTTVMIGDCLEKLKELPDESVNTCVTSPPYWNLRDYGVSNQLGLEDTPEEFVDNLVKVFREVKRVLRSDGTLWLNLGDSYANQRSGEGADTLKNLNVNTHGYKNPTEKQEKTNKNFNQRLNFGNLKQKNLLGLPWRVALALQQDDWYLRQDIIWHKPNPMPESVKDRCTKAHEYIFLLSKSPKYYFDSESIKEDAIYSPSTTKEVERPKGYYKGKYSEPEKANRIDGSFKPIRSKKNKRSVWSVSPKPFKDAHFATFPMKLIEPCILAGCPEKVCVDCGTPYEQKVETKRIPRWELPEDDKRYRPKKYENAHDKLNGSTRDHITETKIIGLQKKCNCQTNKTKGGTVLDIFGGSGTTGIVANSHERDSILIELNKDYVNIMKKRFNDELGLFSKLKILN